MFLDSGQMITIVNGMVEIYVSMLISFFAAFSFHFIQISGTNSSKSILTNMNMTNSFDPIHHTIDSMDLLIFTFSHLFKSGSSRGSDGGFSILSLGFFRIKFTLLTSSIAFRS